MIVAIAIIIGVIASSCVVFSLAHLVAPTVRRWMQWRAIRRQQRRHRIELRKSIARSQWRR